MKNKKILISLIASLSIVSCSGGGDTGSNPTTEYNTSNRFPKAAITAKDERNTEKQKYNGTNVKTDIGTNKDEMLKYLSNNPTYEGVNLSDPP